MAHGQDERLSGRTAQVRLDGDKAILTTEFGLPNEKAQLKHKIDLLIQLRAFTRGISGLIIPRVLDRNDTRGEYVVERAKGINLTEQQGMTVGSTREFFAIPIEKKVEAVIAYFRMVGKVNEHGLAFTDHKTDSVFLQPDGTITIVDGDGMTEQKNPWEQDQIERNGIQDIVFGMFSRGLGEHVMRSEPEYLTPAGVSGICGSLDRAESATVIADRIEGWLHNTYDPSKDHTYNPDPRFMKKELLKPGMTNAQYDIADAQQYLDMGLTSTSFKDYLRFTEKTR